MGLVMRKPVFAYAKTKMQISCAVTAQLISAFVFATWIVQSLLYLNMKFQASSHLLWLYSPVCVGPGRKPRRPVFSEQGSYSLHKKFQDSRQSLKLCRLVFVQPGWNSQRQFSWDNILLNFVSEVKVNHH